MQACRKLYRVTQLFCAFWSQHKPMMLSLCFLFFLLAVAQMLRPMILGSLFNPQSLFNGVYVLIGLNILIVLFSLGRAMLYIRLELQASARVQNAIMHQLMRLPVAFFDRYIAGDLVQRVLVIHSLRTFFSMGQIGGILSFLSLMLSFGLLCYVNWQLTLLVVLGVIFFITLAVLSALYLTPQSEAYVSELSQAYGFLFQCMQGISRIKLFARQQQIADFWQVQYSKLRAQLQQNYDKGILGYAVFNCLPMVLLLLFFVYSSGYSNPPSVLFFCCLLLLINNMTSFYLSIGSVVLDSLIAYKRLRPVWVSPLENIQSVTSANGVQDIKELRFSQVYFSYTFAPLLRDINLTVQRGEHVAFVGLSGSGKSTLCKLLLGFYTPQQGDILINGLALSSLNLAAIRHHVGVVLQDEQLMPGTILENIIGYSGAQEADVWTVLRQLSLHEFIAKLPMGVHTVVSSAIPLLSGGQKQLLLIARALVSSPQVLLLDEATNSLDNPTQALISACINQLKITRITIAHRLSTIRQADRIYVLDQGAIVQTGTYEQLMQQEYGLFYQLALAQGQD